ncbi:hypothetical protein MHYP_G00260510 [Metynnis hypsauchen]
MSSTTLRATEHPGYDNGSFTTYPPMTSLTCSNAVYIFFAVANVIIFILGVAGNGLVIWIAGFKVKKSVVSTWYLSLAVTDFLFCYTLPLLVIFVIKNEWIFGHFLFKFTYFIMFHNWICSIFQLVIISVDRCVVSMFPVWAQNHRTMLRSNAMRSGLKLRMQLGKKAQTKTKGPILPPLIKTYIQLLFEIPSKLN